MPLLQIKNFAQAHFGDLTTSQNVTTPKLTHRQGGKRGQWRKLRGAGYVDNLGMSRQCELHWYEDGDGKRVDTKVERFYY